MVGAACAREIFGSSGDLSWENNADKVLLVVTGPTFITHFGKLLEQFLLIDRWDGLPMVDCAGKYNRAGVYDQYWEWFPKPEWQRSGDRECARFNRHHAKG